MIRKFVWLFCILLTAWLIFNSYQKKSSTVAPDNAVKDAESNAEDVNIGGKFNLVDHYGKKITEDYLVGKNTLVLFGFSRCPHICPAQLTSLTESLDQFKDLQAIFITLDPQKDTVERLAEFHKSFHNRILMLTGSDDEIKNVVESYKIYSNPDEDPAKFNHSAIIYLMGKDGNYLAHFTPADGEELLNDLRQYIS